MSPENYALLLEWMSTYARRNNEFIRRIKMINEATRRFQAGDVVRLKSGGPAMTVIHADYTVMYPRITVDWFDGATRLCGDFLSAQLQHVRIVEGTQKDVLGAFHPGSPDAGEAKAFSGPFKAEARAAEWKPGETRVFVPTTYGATADDLIARLARDLAEMVAKPREKDNWTAQTAWAIAHVAGAVADHVARGLKEE